MIDRIFSRKTRAGIVTMIAASLSLAACGGGGGGGGASPPPPPPPPPITRTPQKAVFVAEDSTLSQLHLYSAGDEGGALTQLSPSFTNPSGNVREFSVSPDGRTVAYVANADAATDYGLYLIAVDGGTPTEVATDFGSNVNIRELLWSPDGTQLAYLANPAGRSSRGFTISEVFLVSRDGSDNRKINGSIGSTPSVFLDRIAWSPDGRYLAQMVTSLSTVRPIGINTYDTTLGTPNSTRVNPAVGTNERIDSHYQWSPAGDRIIYKSNHEGGNRMHVYVSAADGSGTTRIGSAYSTDGRTESYSVAPDGQSVAYSADADADGFFDLYVSDIDGTNVRRLLQNGSRGRAVSFEWSPNSSQIAFSADDQIPGTFEAFVIDPDGTDRTRLNPQMASDRFAGRVMWSPDGRSIAYASDWGERGDYEIYVVDADGGNERQVSGHPEPSGFGEIVWSPDGSMIAYTATSATRNHELFLSTVDGLSTTMVNAALEENQDVNLTGYRWSDDSSRILFFDEYDDFFTRDVLDLWVGTPDGAAPIKLNDSYDFRGFFAYQ